MAVKVRLIEPRLRRVAGVDLHPGLQEVTDKEWTRIKRHPIGASLVERGIIVERVVKTKEPVVEEPVAEPVEAKPVATRAVDLVEEIRETFDVHRLRELANDSRVTVSEAANEQLVNIEG